MPEKTIKSKFYPLQNSEWLRACQELNSAELDVLYYPKTVNPSCEKKTIPCSVIASDLKRNKSTASQTIQALKKKNWLPELFGLQPAEQNNTVIFSEVR